MYVIKESGGLSLERLQATRGVLKAVSQKSKNYTGGIDQFKSGLNTGLTMIKGSFITCTLMTND